MVIQILPRDTRYGELAESFSPLAEGLGYLAGSKISQVRARNAFRQFSVDEQQAESLSRLPQRQRSQMLHDVSERVGYQQQAPESQSQQFQQQAPQQAFQPQQQTMQRLGALQTIQMQPQQRAPAYMQQNVPQSAMQELQAGPQYQQALASGQPRDQLQAAQQGIQALQRAQQTGALGYQPQQQQLAQQQMQQPQRQLGAAPSLAATGGIAPQLPGNAPQIQPRAPTAQAQAPIAPQQSVNALQGPGPKLRAQEAREQREVLGLEIQQKKLELAQRKQENAESQKFYEGQIDQEKAGKEALHKLNKLEELFKKKGNLPPAETYRFYKSLEEDFPSAGSVGTAGAGIGGAIGGALGIPGGPATIATGAAIGSTFGGAVGGIVGLLGKAAASANKASLARQYPDLEQFEKISQDFIKLGKAYFGSRMTDFDLEQFMKTVPNLSLTEQGNMAIIKNMKEMIHLGHEEFEATKWLIKRNNGKRPANIALEVDNLLDPYKNRLANNMKSIAGLS